MARRGIDDLAGSRQPTICTPPPRDVENGLIVDDRVYWGWRGLKSLIANRERNARTH